jgi:two-component system sensor histidine kinase DegS
MGWRNETGGDGMRLQIPRAASQSEAEIRDDERRRLARELHDGPAQSLAGALFGVDLALAAMGHASMAARDELIAARGLVRDALDDVRALMAGLRPRQLEERGLYVALHGLAEMPPLWGTNVTVAVTGIGEGDRLAPDVELALFRIAQEAVSNARRHGSASEVSVSLDVGSREVELVIADDGRGWTGDLLPSFHGRGEGLPGMRERVRLMGGELRIESIAERGTRVIVVAPVRRGASSVGKGGV